MLPCNTTILLGLDFNLLFRGTQASLTLLELSKRYCKEMQDLEKNRDLNQVSWKQEHPHNLASRKNRGWSHLRHLGDRNTFRCRRVTWIPSHRHRGRFGASTPLPSECLCLSCSGVPGLSSRSLLLSLSLLFPPCYLLISKTESDGQGVTVMLYWPALPCTHSQLASLTESLS